MAMSHEAVAVVVLLLALQALGGCARMGLIPWHLLFFAFAFAGVSGSGCFGDACTVCSCGPELLLCQEHNLTQLPCTYPANLRVLFVFLSSCMAPSYLYPQKFPHQLLDHGGCEYFWHGAVQPSRAHVGLDAVSFFCSRHTYRTLSNNNITFINGSFSNMTELGNL